MRVVAGSARSQIEPCQSQVAAAIDERCRVSYKPTVQSDADVTALQVVLRANQRIGFIGEVQQTNGS
jgi:hypothetical protein